MCPYSQYVQLLESTVTSTTKIRELGVQGLGMLMLDCWFGSSVMVEAVASFIEALAILLSTCFLIFSLLASMRQLQPIPCISCDGPCTWLATPCNSLRQPHRSSHGPCGSIE